MFLTSLVVVQAELQFEGAGGLWPQAASFGKLNVSTCFRCLLPDQSGSITVRLPTQVGCATLTTHRLLWMDTSAFPNPGSSCQLPLSAVSEVQLKASMMLRSPKIRVLTFVDEHGKVAPGEALHPRLQQSFEATSHATPYCPY